MATLSKNFKELVQSDCLHECFKFGKNLSNIAGNNFTVIYVQECR